VLKYEGWPCTKAEHQLITEHGKHALANWGKRIHPADHVLAITAGWEPDNEGTGFSRSVNHDTSAHVASAGARRWSYRRRKGGTRIVCRTIVAAMAKAHQDVRASKETPF